MKPLIAIVCDTSIKGPHLYHSAGDKYITAVADVAGCLPVLLPAIGDTLPIEDFLARVNGVLVTGGYSNIQRQRYGQPPAPLGELEDPRRDANDLALIPAALNMGLPILGICRGFQEFNVALGGTLHPRLHEVDGRIDHRENPDDPLDVQYGPAHSVTLASEGVLHAIMGESEFMVNTLHGQGIDQLADSLTLEAEADDGTPEAVSVMDAKTFAIAVQWHPEWRAADNPQSRKLFTAFGDAARRHLAAQTRPL